jgi:large subunit ribosomal protein L4e
MSRIPRKIMWRRGTQFSWVGATSPNTIGGRRAHPPKGLGALKKINKKEMKKAMLSALSYITSIEELKKKYSSLNNKKLDIKLPLVVEEKVLLLKTKEFMDFLKKILGELNNVAIQKKSVRTGIGKLRGRKNKKNAGLLFIIGNNESKKIKGIEIVKTNELKIKDLADGGARLTIFSEKAISELEANLRK